MAHDDQTRRDQFLLELLPDCTPVAKQTVREALQKRASDYWTEHQFNHCMRVLMEAGRVTSTNDAQISLAKTTPATEYAVWLTRVALAELINDAQRDFYGQQILQKIRELYPEDRYPHWQVNNNTYAVYLTRMSQDWNSRVTRASEGYGYTLRQLELPRGPAQPKGESAPGADQRAPLGERMLYRLLAEWLKSREYGAKITADAKGGGQWGNPDVTGIRVSDTIWNSLEVEVTTIEAKSSTADWRKWIFEAIAHKRFSDRSYYAFPVISPAGVRVEEVADYQNMREYGERYGVGIVAVFIQPETLADLAANQTADDLLLSGVQFLEVLPAPRHPASALDKNEFLQNVAGVYSISDLFNFGD